MYALYCISLVLLCISLNYSFILYHTSYQTQLKPFHVTKSFMPISIIYKQQTSSLYISPSDTTTAVSDTSIPPNFDDMKKLAYILANVTDHLDTSPDIALSIASQEMGWLYSRNVPKLTQMLLTEYPSIRQDKAMMRAYMFLMDFLEAVSKETNLRLKENQVYLKNLLEAAKISEKKLNEHIVSNRDKLTNADFSLYLDTEIEAQETNSIQENMLVTIKLRLLEEKGKDLGVDVMLLPKLAAEGDPAELRRKTLQHLEGYDRLGQELFLQTLKIMVMEMKKRYQSVDPLLLLNLKEIEKITEGLLLSNKNQ